MKNHTANRTSSQSFLTFAVLIALLVVGFSNEAVAQSQNDGSIYSRFGLGLRQSFSSSKNQAMGGGGYALNSNQYLNTSNPAAYSDQYLTRFSGGLTYESITASATGAESGRLASGSLSGINFGFPIKAAQTGIGLSFAPYTRVNYRVDVEDQLNSDPDSDIATPVRTSFKGNGGLQSLSAGIGHRYNSNLHVGASIDVIFGILEDFQQTLFNSASFTDRSVVSSTRLSGVSGVLGFRYVVPNMPSDQGLVVAGTFHLPTTLKGTRTRALVNSVDRDTLGTSTDGTVKLPLGFGLGLAYQPVPKWTIVGDLDFENWSALESDFNFAGFDATGSPNTSNRIRVSA